MSKLPAVKPRELVKFLEERGFVLDHVSAATSSITTLPRSVAPWFLRTASLCYAFENRQCRWKNALMSTQVKIASDEALLS
jgi:hypothetical protein